MLKSQAKYSKCGLEMGDEDFQGDEEKPENEVRQWSQNLDSNSVSWVSNSGRTLKFIKCSNSSID